MTEHDDILGMLNNAIADYARYGFNAAWNELGPPLTVETFRDAVEMVERETIQPNYYSLSPKQWEWFKWAMERLGVTTVEEVMEHLAAEDRWYAYLLSVGWRPDPS